MATVDSTSTREEVLDAIADNASYREDNSVAKCKAFITALRVFIHKWRFVESRENARQIRYSESEARLDLASAEAWLNANNTGNAPYGRVKQYSVGSFRD
jgi:hypothetical protein